MPQGYRQLPDGTWLNEVTGTVEAPLVDDPRMSATAGPTAPAVWKSQPSPAAGPGGPLLLPDAPAPQAGPIAGLNGNYPVPGGMQMHMRPGRNYPALGDGGFTGARRAIAIAGIVGVCALTVWLQRRGGAKKAG